MSKRTTLDKKHNGSIDTYRAGVNSGAAAGGGCV